MKKRVLPWLFAVSTPLIALAQEKDTAFLHVSIDHTIARYKKAVGVQARLYNGRKYTPPAQDFDQHPYYLSEDWLMGDVFYDGEFFSEVPLMYDLLGGTLITEHISSGQPIELVTEKLNHFTIGGHHFEKLENTPDNGLPRTGFYDILYDGPTRLVAHREKLQKKEISSNAIEIVYDEKTRYFLYHGTAYTPVKRKASVLKVLEGKKAELKRFARKNRTTFAFNRELLLKKLAAYYDTLE